MALIIEKTGLILLTIILYTHDLKLVNSNAIIRN